MKHNVFVNFSSFMVPRVKVTLSFALTEQQQHNLILKIPQCTPTLIHHTGSCGIFGGEQKATKPTQALCIGDVIPKAMRYSPDLFSTTEQASEVHCC